MSNDIRKPTIEEMIAFNTRTRALIAEVKDLTARVTRLREETQVELEEQHAEMAELLLIEHYDY